MLVKSCISVYRKEDNPGSGYAQKHLLVWLTSGSHSTLQVSRVISRTSLAPLPAVPWCCRQSKLTVAAVSPGMGKLSNEKRPLITTPWDWLKPFLLSSIFLSRLKWHVFKDTGGLSGTGVLWWWLCSLSSSQIRDWWIALRWSLSCTPLLHAVLSPVCDASLGCVRNENQKPASALEHLFLLLPPPN